MCCPALHPLLLSLQPALASWAVGANVSARLWTGLKASPQYGRATDENGTSIEPDFWGWEQYAQWGETTPDGVLVSPPRWCGMHHILPPTKPPPQP